MVEGAFQHPAELKRNEEMAVITAAKLTCPACGFIQDAEMPTDSCQFFFECASCRTVLRPRQGDCCVFCSYADRRCPSKQVEDAEHR